MNKSIDLFNEASEEEIRFRRNEWFLKHRPWLFLHLDYWFKTLRQPPLTPKEKMRIVDVVFNHAYRYSFTSEGILVMSGGLKSELDLMRKIPWEKSPMDSGGVSYYTLKGIYG